MPSNRRNSFISQDAARQLSHKNISNQKTISILTEKLQGEKKKNEELQRELDGWKQRLVEREKEFRHIISKVESERDQIRDSGGRGNKIPSFISNLHLEINSKIQERGDDTIKMINLRLKSNVQHMDKKLEVLKKEMKQKINQQKSLTLENLTEIFLEMEQVKDMAMSIDAQNNKLISDIRELKIKNKILAEERNMAISENVVNSLKFRESREPRRDSRSSKRLTTDPKRVKSERKTANNSLTVSQQINFTSNANRFMGEPIFDSPRQRFSQKKRTDIFEFGSSSNRKQRSIVYFQRSSHKDRNKNIDLTCLLGESPKRERNQTSLSPDRIQKSDEFEEFQIRPKQVTIDLSDLRLM